MSNFQGKGSRQRPLSGTREEFYDKYDKIFKRPRESKVSMILENFITNMFLRKKV